MGSYWRYDGWVYDNLMAINNLTNNQQMWKLRCAYSDVLFDNVVGAASVSGSFTTAASTLYLTFLPVMYETTFAKIAMTVTSGGVAGSSSRLGIYRANGPGGYPGDLISGGDLGTITTTSSGEKSISSSVTLFGNYWLAQVTSAHTPLFNQVNAGDGLFYMPMPPRSITTTTFPYALTEGSVSSYFSALPSDLSGDTFTVIDSTTNHPALYLKLS